MDPLNLVIAMAKDWMDPVVVRDAPERVPNVLRQLVEHLEALSLIATERWQPIETAPQDGRMVLLYGVEDRRHIFGSGYWSEVSWATQSFFVRHFDELGFEGVRSLPPDPSSLSGRPKWARPARRRTFIPTHWRPMFYGPALIDRVRG